ncbi:hypothetical protein GCM10023091_40990 [Ravibacter arvi]|uniref:Lipocalin-like domain-containing protein n=2 Tax=Ravibacter arvi TaxID=2051041 RepID=A0ABP8MBZ9_9BACT
MNMNRHLRLILGVAFCVLLGFTACKKKKPVSERIAKAWVAQSVKHDATEVYVVGGSNNAVPGYSNYLLILDANKTATLEEFDNTSYTGEWELSGETTLILKNLGPEPPTGSNGRLEFTIKTLDDDKLVLSRLSPSLKTGNTVNEYTLKLR